jgi:SAM-dependent methyltransferase
MKFSDLLNNEDIYLYCGDMNIQRREVTNKDFVGMSLTQDNQIHIKHDIIKKIDLNDNSVDIIQSEDVMEHIEYDKLVDIFNEFYRILKPGGIFRLSMPDYSCDILNKRSFKDINGNIVFDKGGGGDYDFKNNKVINGGHLWFPKYNLVKFLIDSSNFSKGKIEYLHYYDENNNPIHKKIDYSKGYISRTPDHDDRVKNPYRPMSIVVDCHKL